MPDNSDSAADEKEETKEKNVDWPGLDETFSLRECAKRISDSRKGSSGSFDPNPLLQELKKGSLSAGFHLPTDPLIWIDIPAQRWIGVTKAEFDSIRLKSGSKIQTGNFTFELSEFLDQYIEARIRASSAFDKTIDRNWLRDVTNEFYLQADKSFDVVVSAESWRTFASLNNVQEVSDSRFSAADLSEDRAERKGKQGRNALGGWEKMYAALAMYLLKDIPRETSADYIAAAVLEKIDKIFPDETLEIPKHDTFMKKIQQHRSQAKKIF